MQIESNWKKFRSSSAYLAVVRSAQLSKLGIFPRHRAILMIRKTLLMKFVSIIFQLYKVFQPIADSSPGVIIWKVRRETGRLPFFLDILHGLFERY